MKLQIAEDSSMAFEATVRVASNECLQEFGQSSTADNCMQCYVPVENGQTIFVTCKVSNLLKGSVIDFTVDGILRDTYTHNTETVRNFVLDFDMGIFAHRRSLRRGKLTVNSKRQHSFYSEGRGAVGALEVRLYRQEITNKTSCKRFSHSPLEISHYRELGLPWNCYGILQDTELVISGDQLLTQSKRNSYKKKFDADRPGLGPWAVMRFVYRLQESLQENGIMPKDAHSSFTVNSDGSVLRPLILRSGSSSGINAAGNSTPQVIDEGDQDGTLAVREKKRKRDEYEVDDMVDSMLFGMPVHVNGTRSGYIFDDWGNPVKTTADEMEKLEQEVEALRNMARNSEQKASASRERLADRARALTAEQRRWIELQKRKELYTAEIARNNKEDEVYQAKLNRQEG